MKRIVKGVAYMCATLYVCSYNVDRNSLDVHLMRQCASTGSEEDLTYLRK